MGAFRDLWSAWKRIARRIGEAQARVLLSLFYYVFLPPFALLYRIAGGKPLSRASWHAPKSDNATHAARAARQW